MTEPDMKPGDRFCNMRGAEFILLRTDGTTSMFELVDDNGRRTGYGIYREHSYVAANWTKLT